MSAPLIRDGAIAFRNGTIVAVGQRKFVRRDFPHAIETDFGDAVILPALINAHTHLELSELPRPPVPGSLSQWLLRVMQNSAPFTDKGNDRIRAAVHEGIRQCIRFGVGTIADITSRPSITRAVLREGPLRTVSFGEVRAMAQRRPLLEARLADAADRSLASPHLRIGVSPHSPYSVEVAGYRRCHDLANSAGLPLTTHLAETAEESEFLAQQTGPLRDLWEAIGGWDGSVPTFSGGPIRLAKTVGFLDDATTLLAHVNYADDQELALLASGKASVVYCPRTHDYFGHPPHRWREMLKLGINVAIGTDSCASAGDLNLVDDLRLLRARGTDLAPEALWQLITVRAARSLGMTSRIGALAPDRAADFCVFATASDDPLREVLEIRHIPQSLWIAGKQITVDAI